MSAAVSLAELRLTRSLAASNHAEGLTTLVMSDKLATVCDLLLDFHALATRYAKECGECEGSGQMPHYADRSTEAGRAEPIFVDCTECADIRAAGGRLLEERREIA